MYELFIIVNEKSVLFVYFDVLQIVDYYWAITCIHRRGDGIWAWTGSCGSHHAQHLSLSSSSFAAWTCYCHKVSNKNAQNKKSKNTKQQCTLFINLFLNWWVFFRSKPPLVSMVIYWNQSTNSVTMYSGPYTLVVENSTSSQAFDFTSLAFKFISISIQVCEFNLH